MPPVQEAMFKLFLLNDLVFYLSSGCGLTAVKTAHEVEADMDQADQHRYLHQGPDHGSEGDGGADAEDGDGHRDGQLEVVARGVKAREALRA